MDMNFKQLKASLNKLRTCGGNSSEEAIAKAETVEIELKSRIKENIIFILDIMPEDTLVTAAGAPNDTLDGSFQEMCKFIIDLEGYLHYDAAATAKKCAENAISTSIEKSEFHYRMLQPANYTTSMLGGFLCLVPNCARQKRFPEDENIIIAHVEKEHGLIPKKEQKKQ